MAAAIIVCQMSVIMYGCSHIISNEKLHLCTIPVPVSPNAFWGMPSVETGAVRWALSSLSASSSALLQMIFLLVHVARRYRHVYAAQKWFQTLQGGNKNNNNNKTSTESTVMTNMVQNVGCRMWA